MKDWILASATALVAVASLADAPSAAEPWSSPPVRSNSKSLPRAQIFPAAHAWVNSMRQEAAGPALRPAIAGHANIGQGGREPAEAGDHGAMIAATAWNGEHQYTGYVYTPGACDHTPPCVDHLWDGYCQRPCRCKPHGHHFHRGCGFAMGGCASCGNGCGSCGAHFGGCHGCRLHGLKHFGGCSSCASSYAPACDACNTGCGHGLGLGHFGHKCRGWFNNLCNACDGGLACGCSDSIGSGAPAMAPNGVAPEVVPTPSKDLPTPPPAADDAKSARSNFNRYFPWSIK